MQLHFVIIIVGAYWCVSTRAYKTVTPLIVSSDTNNVCPSENMLDNARQLLKNIVSTKISSDFNSETSTTEPPTSGTTSISIPTTTTTTIPPVVLLQSTLFGGTSGSYFDDHYDDITGIVGMQIRAGSIVDSIQVTYRLRDGSNFAAPMHGDTGGSEYSFTLANGEKLTRMEGMTDGMYINTLTFYSNLNNVYGPYGILSTQTQFYVDAEEIVAFFGHYGLFLNGIGVYYTI